MMKTRRLFVIVVAALTACGGELPPIHPTIRDITESVYASGIVKGAGQYNASAESAGIVDTVFVAEGDSVTQGQPILAITNDVQRLNTENAQLKAGYDDYRANGDKIREARLHLEVLRSKMVNDSMLFVRQAALWKQDIGTRIAFEERQLAWVSSKNAVSSAELQLADLERQLAYASRQSQKSLQIAGRMENGYLVKSEISGRVYALPLHAGETANAQTPVAVIGSDARFLLELQVDEHDIPLVRPGQEVVVTMDSYKGEVFTARVTRIVPLMNSRNKTFLVDATFTRPPARLFPNSTLEANIVIRTQKRALLVPRAYLLNDSTVIAEDGKHIAIKTGLTDYRYVQVVSGLGPNDELIRPRP